MINCAWRNILTASFLSAFKYRAKRARKNSRERNGREWRRRQRRERCIELPVKGVGCAARGRAAYPFNSRGVNDSRKKKRNCARRKCQKASWRVYTDSFHVGGENLAPFSTWRSQPTVRHERPVTPRRAAPRTIEPNAVRRGVAWRRSACACTKSTLQTH